MFQSKHHTWSPLIIPNHRTPGFAACYAIASVPTMDYASLKSSTFFVRTVIESREILRETRQRPTALEINQIVFATLTKTYSVYRILPGGGIPNRNSIQLVLSLPDSERHTGKNILQSDRTTGQRSRFTNNILLRAYQVQHYH